MVNIARADDFIGNPSDLTVNSTLRLSTASNANPITFSVPVVFFTVPPVENDKASPMTITAALAGNLA
jgi:hypothetical protein